MSSIFLFSEFLIAFHFQKCLVQQFGSTMTMSRAWSMEQLISILLISYPQALLPLSMLQLHTLLLTFLTISKNFNIILTVQDFVGWFVFLERATEGTSLQGSLCSYACTHVRTYMRFCFCVSVFCLKDQAYNCLIHFYKRGISMHHHASCIMYYASCIMHHASYIMHHASCIKHQASSIMHHASYIMYHTS